MSLFLLGILNAQAAGAGAAPGDWDLLESDLLDSAAASFSFTGLSTYSTDYQHLQLRLSTRTSTAEVGAQLLMKLNDTSLNVNQQYGNGSTANTEYFTTEDIMVWTYGTNGPTDAFGGAIIDIANPFDTNRNKTVKSFSGNHSTAERVGIGGASLFSTSAVTSITIEDRSGGNLLANSRASLYGLRSVAV